MTSNTMPFLGDQSCILNLNTKRLYRRWTNEERHMVFLGIFLYGSRDVQSIVNMLHDRNEGQVKSYISKTMSQEQILDLVQGRLPAAPPGFQPTLKLTNSFRARYMEVTQKQSSNEMLQEILNVSPVDLQLATQFDQERGGSDNNSTSCSTASHGAQAARSSEWDALLRIAASAVHPDTVSAESVGSGTLLWGSLLGDTLIPRNAQSSTTPFLSQQLPIDVELLSARPPLAPSIPSPNPTAPSPAPTTLTAPNGSQEPLPPPASSAESMPVAGPVKHVLNAKEMEMAMRLYQSTLSSPVRAKSNVARRVTIADTSAAAPPIRRSVIGPLPPAYAQRTEDDPSSVHWEQGGLPGSSASVPCDESVVAMPADDYTLFMSGAGDSTMWPVSAAADPKRPWASGLEKPKRTSSTSNKREAASETDKTSKKKSKTTGKVSKHPPKPSAERLYDPILGDPGNSLWMATQDFQTSSSRAKKTTALPPRLSFLAKHLQPRVDGAAAAQDVLGEEEAALLSSGELPNMHATQDVLLMKLTDELSFMSGGMRAADP